MFEDGEDDDSSSLMREMKKIRKGAELSHSFLMKMMYVSEWMMGNIRDPA